MEVSGNSGESKSAASLRRLFHKLALFKVLTWSSSSSDKDTDRERVTGLPSPRLAEADVASSWIYQTGSDPKAARHVVAIDIDHPSWLVKSSTPGHYHLYIDVPNGISWPNYSALLRALAGAGVIERGYADASIERGHSDVRLPWVHKEPEPDPMPMPLSSDPATTLVSIDPANQKFDADVNKFVTYTMPTSDETIRLDLIRRAQIQSARRL